MKDKEKMFVVRKFIKAANAREAIEKEKEVPVDEIYIDEDWKKGPQGLADAIGFHMKGSEDEELSTPS